MAETTKVPMAVPPHSLDSEKSVLGSMIQDESALKLAVGSLKADDFYAPVHRELFDVMCNLSKSRSPVDIVTVDAELVRRGTLEAVGGTSYLIEITQYVPTTANVQAYISIVVEKSKLRKLIQVSRDISAAAYTGVDRPDDIRDKMILGLKDIKVSDAPSLITTEQALTGLLDRISEVTKTPEDDRIATGIPSLDKIIRISGSKYVAIAARPTVGKSTLALQISDNAARKHKQVLFSSLEMDEVEIVERLLARESGVSVSRLTSGNLTDRDYLAIGPSCGSIAPLPIMFTTECFTVEKLRRAAFSMAESNGLDMVVVDYIQLMRHENKKLSRYERITEISGDLRMLAQELKIPILVLCQLNRQSEGGTTKDGRRIRRPPTMAEARDSGAIEQDANIFLILHDPDESEMKTEADKNMFADLRTQELDIRRIIIEKNRQGPRNCFTDTVFDGAHMRLTALKRD